MTVFWLNDPSILMKINDITSFFPKKSDNMEEKLNAITRTIIILTSLGYLYTQSENIAISGVLTIGIIIGLYLVKTGKFGTSVEGYKNKEVYETLTKNFTAPTEKNPLMNVTPMDYTENPERKRALPSYNNCVTEDLNKKIKNNIEKSMEVDNRLFNNLGDNLVFDQSMRNFYTTPNTEIPNNQKSFTDFCYGNMPSCKDGTSSMCIG